MRIARGLKQRRLLIPRENQDVRPGESRPEVLLRGREVKQPASTIRIYCGNEKSRVGLAAEIYGDEEFTAVGTWSRHTSSGKDLSF